MFDLSGQVAVVTGASSGIGVEMALALARQGADIAILARRAEKLEQVAKSIRQLGAQCLAVPCDVTSQESIQAAADSIVSSFGKVDILVNNAGGGRPIPAEDCSLKDWMDLVDLNMNSVFMCAQIFGRIMLKNGYGRIINIASMYGLVGSLGTKNIPYATAKGGVINMTRGLGSEWASRGVNVNAISPGYFITEATEKFVDMVSKIAEEKNPIHRVGRPGELDAAVVFLASKEASFVVGVTIPVDGGYTCV